MTSYVYQKKKKTLHRQIDLTNYLIYIDLISVLLSLEISLVDLLW